MAAIDVIITLAIIIKIIDIFVMRHKKKNKAISKEQDTTASNKIPVLIVIVIILVGIAATNQRETDPKPVQQVNQTPATKYPAGMYMQPLLSTTTGIIEEMGKGIQANAIKAQQKAKDDLLKATQKAQEKERLRHKQW